jgi:hypothetical protein
VRAASSRSQRASRRACLVACLACGSMSSVVRRCPPLLRLIVTQLVTHRLGTADHSLVRYIQLVGWRRLPGTSPLDPSLSVGLIPMPLWSALVVNLWPPVGATYRLGGRLACSGQLPLCW